jgi:hypothetical protein
MKLKRLENALRRLSLHREAYLIHDLIKIADSRRSIEQILHMTKEEANFFHNIDSAKSYTIARWIKDWRTNKYFDWNGPYADIQSEFDDFKRNYSISGDERYFDQDFDSFNLIDSIKDFNDLYQKVEKKDLEDAYKIFELYITQRYSKGEEVLESEKYSWYDVGQKCIFSSHYLKNCGDIGLIGSDGDWSGEGGFSILSLKDSDGRPAMIATVGRAYHPGSGDYIKVIVNVSGKLNKFPEDKDLLKHLFNLANEKGYNFARLYDGSNMNQIIQTPGLDEEKLNGEGFEVLNCYLNYQHEDLYGGAGEEG